MIRKMIQTAGKIKRVPVRDWTETARYPGNGQQVHGD